MSVKMLLGNYNRIHVSFMHNAIISLRFNIKVSFRANFEELSVDIMHFSGRKHTVHMQINQFCSKSNWLDLLMTLLYTL